MSTDGGNTNMLIVSGRYTRDESGVATVDLMNKKSRTATAASDRPKRCERGNGSASVLSFVTNGVVHDVETWFRDTSEGHGNADQEEGWSLIHEMDGMEVLQRVIA